METNSSTYTPLSDRVLMYATGLNEWRDVQMAFEAEHADAVAKHGLFSEIAKIRLEQISSCKSQVDLHEQYMEWAIDGSAAA